MTTEFTSAIAVTAASARTVAEAIEELSTHASAMDAENAELRRRLRDEQDFTLRQQREIKRLLNRRCTCCGVAAPHAL